MKRSTFPTPQDAEAAFYEALERADLEAMMEVWAEDEQIVCVHPAGPRLSGYEQVRDSWSQIFSSRQRLRVHLSNQVYVQAMMLSIHSLHENILVGDETKPGAPMVTTNVFVRTGNGWRMLVHHASPAPASTSGGGEAPKILH